MRKTIIIILGIVVLLLAGYAGYRGYRVSKNKHLISMARQYMAKADGRDALLCVQQVLSSDADNRDATRLMADLAEASRSPSALLWRTRVVQLNPHSLADRIALAQTAVRLHDFATATNALAGVNFEDKKGVPYLMAAGTVAAAGGNPAQAEVDFIEATKLEPQNMSAQLNLAIVELYDTNALVVAGARNSLQTIRYSSTNSFLRCQALRELVVDAMRHQQYPEALLLSRGLLQETNASFGDRLLQLDLLHTTHDAGFRPALEADEREAAADPAKIFDLASWQMAKTSPVDALKWLRSLPAKVQTNQSVEVLAAQCLTQAKDWRGLQSQIESQNWSELEFIRDAYLCLALRGQGLSDSYKAEWEVTTRAVNNQKERLVLLLRLVSQWGWANESEEILWDIAQRYPGEQWAVKALTQTYLESGRTSSALRLFELELTQNPNDLAAKNNVAFCALLLNAQEQKPNELAKAVYLASPANDSYISTYALSLYLQGKNTEALKVIQQMTPQGLQTPENSGYYGLILKATGNGKKAKIYLNWATKSRLLPEEKALFDQAKVGL